MAQQHYTVISRLCVSHYFSFVAYLLHYFVRKSVYLRVRNENAATFKKRHFKTL